MTETVEFAKPDLPENLNGNARVWIYQLEEFLTPQEEQFIRNACEQFVPRWQAHGKNLKADYRLLYHRFLCLFVDETGQGATGCSIDASVRFVQELEKALGKDFMSRMQVVYINEDKRLASTYLNQLGTEVNDDTLVFNNLVQTLDEMKQGWLTPAGKSWHKRFLN